MLKKITQCIMIVRVKLLGMSPYEDRGSILLNALTMRVVNCYNNFRTGCLNLIRLHYYVPVHIPARTVS
jgi:hypothetical protein